MKSRPWRATIVFGLLAGVLPCERSQAVNPETLLMPGKVTAAHQKWEEQCSMCHDRKDRSRQTQLCLDCHKEIAADIGGKRGFHGHMVGMQTSECRACHSEHLGRSGDIVKLSREQFDHDRTEFPLHGRHVGLQCGSCHEAGKPLRKAPTQCADCHKKDDRHEGSLGRDCAACHDASSWRHTRFDHDKTAFALHDKHAQIPCAGCHQDNRYKGTPKECVSCHATDDVHRGSRGPQCADCHTTRAWKTSKFDHEKETGFALLGMHDHLACNDCHRSGNLKDKLPRECFGCHQGQDSHAGRLGKECGKCHDNEHWRPATFDHDRDTRWALSGRHAKVECHSCHTAAVATQKLSTECVSCHRSSDAHAGKLGRDCSQCHTTQGWRTGISFDHDLIDFPLLGLHVAVPCEQCHISQRYRDVSRECIGCHSKDDYHKGGLGKDCAQCHSPNGWRIWQFDHGKKTGFALAGAHAKIACSGCHKQPADQVKLKSECVSCHAQDDVHLGQYGPRCDRCHSAVTFKGAMVH